jgi:hypothetical protein
VSITTRKDDDRRIMGIILIFALSFFFFIFHNFIYMILLKPSSIWMLRAVEEGEGNAVSRHFLTSE